MFPLLIFTALIREVNSVLCYNCTAASDSNCETVPRSTKWIECSGPCQVWKLYSEAELKTYMFERSCNEYCHQGCTHLADMEHRFVGCSSCCQTDFCNAGNSAGSISLDNILLLFISLIPFRWVFYK